jgi:uncharacterized membrane protein YhaH (DUF805 family)
MTLRAAFQIMVGAILFHLSFWWVWLIIAFVAATALMLSAGASEKAQASSIFEVIQIFLFFTAVFSAIIGVIRFVKWAWAG